MAKADTKDRIGRIELLDQFDADASVFGSSWSWREDDERWIELFDRFDIDFVISCDLDFIIAGEAVV